MKIEIISNSPEDTRKIASLIAGKVREGDCIALFGDLGVGKTCFVKAFAVTLGFDGLVTSPTFNIVHHYPARIPIFHFDMYRIENEDQLYDIGFYDYLSQPGVLIIEWSENIKSALPKNNISIKIEYTNKENQRKISIFGKELENEDFSD